MTFYDIKVVSLTTLTFCPGMQDRLALITYLIPYNGYSFSLFCPHSLTVLLIFMNIQ